MARQQADSPIEVVGRALRNGWNTLLSVYYASSLSWRLLKSGALLFLGFFLWAGSNIVLSYRPGWGLLRYAMAYGFLLIVYGPIHHAVVIPVALRWRRAEGLRRRLGKRLPNIGLAAFLIGVAILGTTPVGPMTIDFQSSLEDAGADIDPDLLCVKHAGANGTTVHCHLAESQGIDQVSVYSGKTRLLTDRDPPFEFTVHEDALRERMGEKRFVVVLLDEGDETIRRYTRTLSMIESE